MRAIQRTIEACGTRHNVGSASVKRQEVSVSQSRDQEPTVGARLGRDGLKSFQWGVSELGVQRARLGYRYRVSRHAASRVTPCELRAY